MENARLIESTLTETMSPRIVDGWTLKLKQITHEERRKTTMKKTETFVVLRDKETGRFLVEYKNNGRALAYSVKNTDKLSNASKNDVTATKEQIEEFKKLAEAFDCELLEVTATYELKTFDGKEPEDLTESIEEAKKEAFKHFLKMFVKSSAEDE